MAPDATSYIDIICVDTAGGKRQQFKGFGTDDNGPTVSDGVERRATNVFQAANTANAPAHAKAVQFVENLFSVLDGPVSDPFRNLKKIGNKDVTGGAYGVRTEGDPMGGGSFVEIPDANNGEIGGNRFYTLLKRNRMAMI